MGQESHQPEVYPIYDSYVEELLVYLRDVDHFADFCKEDLRNISAFKQTLLSQQKFYSLETFSLKEIDQYMWQYGKKMFSKLASRLACRINKGTVFDTMGMRS